MRYDEAYSRRARRAVLEGGIDLETFILDLQATGTSNARIEELLLEDLKTGGQIFGKFKRSLTGAASTSIAAAERQGYTAQIGIDAHKELINIFDTNAAIRNADSAYLDKIEKEIGGRQPVMRVAELENTCHRCLPLHGTTRTIEEWNAAGLHPDVIHSGWKSDCHCNLVPSQVAEKRNNAIDPLIRKKVESKTGLKGVKRTQRQVAQIDPEKSRAAVIKAQQTPEGRRTLRLMGQVKANDEGGK